MSEEKKTEEIDDDGDLFGDDSEGEGDRIVAAARHMRVCSNCRPNLLRHAKEPSKFILSEVERELERPLEPAERKVLAKALLINFSMNAAAGVAMQKAMGPFIEQVEKALAGTTLTQPFKTGGGFGGPTGEA